MTHKKTEKAARKFADGGVVSWDDVYRHLSANAGGINMPNTTSARNASSKVRKKMDEMKARIDRGASTRIGTVSQGPLLRLGKMGAKQGPEKKAATPKSAVVVSEQDWIRDKANRGPLMKGNGEKMSEEDVASAYRRRKAGQSNVSEYPGQGTRSAPKEYPGRGTGGARVAPKKEGAITQTEFVKLRQGQNRPDSTANQGNKKDNPTQLVKQGGFKGNWKGAAPARAPKSLQEAVRRGMGDSYTRRKVNKRNLKDY